MKFGVIIFPGSNCDHDAYWTIQQVAKQPVTFLWHDSHDLQNCDAIIVPEASPSATTFAPAPSPSSRPSWNPSASSRPVGD